MLAMYVQRHLSEALHGIHPAPTTAKLAVGLLLWGARRKRQVDWIVSRDCTLMVRAYRICDGQYRSANVPMRQESLPQMEVMSTSYFG